MPEEKRDTLTKVNNNLIQSSLLRLGVTKEELIEVAQKSLAARLEATENDVDSAPGWMAWNYGTRAVRELFRSKGWDRWCYSNIHGVKHADENILIIFQNVDLACATGHIPKAISKKGKCSAKIVDVSQGDLFHEDELENVSVQDIDTFEVWYLCVSYDDIMGLRAELSQPKPLAEKRDKKFQFSGFHNRIFLLEGDDDIRVQHVDVDNEEQIEFDVPVSKKSG